MGLEVKLPNGILLTNLWAHLKKLLDNQSSLVNLRKCVRLTVFVITLKPRILWIGDSHASFISADRLVDSLTPSTDGDMTFWLGPQLAWNFRFEDHFGGLQLRALTFSSASVGVLVLGEIDVRVHLGHDISKRSAHWVRSYVSEAIRAKQALRLDRLIVCGPVPPTDNQKINVDFPVRGSLESRISATRWLVEELRLQCQGTGIEVLDLEPLVGDESGALKGAFNLDGCHLNAAGTSVLRNAVQELVSLPREPPRIRH